MAKDRSITPSQLALAWVMNNQAITAPIIGVSAMRHLDDALGALGIVLSAEELDRCDELYLSLNDFDPKADRRDIRVIS